MKILLILIKIFVIGALLIISNQSLVLSDSADRAHLFNEYNLWLSHLFEKGISIVSYVIKNEWLPETS